MSISIGTAFGLVLRKVVPTSDMGGTHLTCLAPLEKSQNLWGEGPSAFLLSPAMDVLGSWGRHAMV